MNLYVISEQVGLQGYWITDILDGISKEALKKNISVTDYDGKPLKINDEFTRPLVLAVGYSAQWMEMTCNDLHKQGIDPVLVNATQTSYTEMLYSVGYVSFEVKRAIHDVMTYLLSLDRGKMAFFGAHDETYADNIKAEEFLRLSKHMNLSSDEGDVYKGNYLAGCAKAFEKNIEKYNAVICSNDAAALYLLKRLEERGVRVPEDICLVGFGNSRVSEYITPSITTVDNNYIELGKQAVKLHQFLQRNPDIDCTSVSVNCKLIVRQSTGGRKQGEYQPEFIHDGSLPLYHADPDVMMVLQAEELLRMWDDIDRSIVTGLVANKTVVSIADGLFISVSAVKYRIKKMLTSANFRTKSELVRVIKKYNVL